MDYGHKNKAKKYVYDVTAFKYSLTDNKIEDEKTDMEFAEVEFQLETRMV